MKKVIWTVYSDINGKITFFITISHVDNIILMSYEIACQ